MELSYFEISQNIIKYEASDETQKYQINLFEVGNVIMKGEDLEKVKCCETEITSTGPGSVGISSNLRQNSIVRKDISVSRKDPLIP